MLLIQHHLTVQGSQPFHTGFQSCPAHTDISELSDSFNHINFSLVFILINENHTPRTICPYNLFHLLGCSFHNQSVVGLLSFQSFFQPIPHFSDVLLMSKQRHLFNMLPVHYFQLNAWFKLFANHFVVVFFFLFCTVIKLLKLGCK